MPKGTSQDIGKLLEDSGAVLRGHFILTSGRHSDVYFEKFRLLERPDVISALASELLEPLRESDLAGALDLVAGPTTGGIIIAFEVARQLGLPAIYVESEGGRRTLRRGASIQKGSRVLVVDDVLTTGKSVREVIDVVRQASGEIAAVAVLINRSESQLDFGCPLIWAHKVDAQSFAADEVPEWLAAIPVRKPGTGAVS